MLKFSDIDIKALIAVPSFCLAIGIAIDYFSKFNWLTSGLILFLALLVNGLIISIEDRAPGGLDHDENESIESRKAYKKSVALHLLIIFIVAMLAVWSASTGG